MVKLVAPNGSIVEASEDAAQKLMENGFAKADKQEPQKKSTRPRRRSVKK